MKVFLLALTLLTITASVFSQENNLRFLASLNGAQVPVYSMVWSAKSYTTTGLEQKTFFFAIPFSFNTIMTVDTQAKSINLNFIDSKNDSGNFHYVKESVPLIEKSWWGQFMTFTDNYTKIDLNLELNEAEYTVERIKLYQNTTFRNVQIKLVKVNDKFKNALYVTFDLQKQVAGGYIDSFIDFLKATFPHAKVVG